MPPKPYLAPCCTTSGRLRAHVQGEDRADTFCRRKPLLHDCESYRREDASRRLVLPRRWHYRSALGVHGHLRALAARCARDAEAHEAGGEQTRSTCPANRHSRFLVVFAILGRPGGGVLMTSFFTLVPVAYGVLFSLAWLLGADLLDHRTSGERTTFYSRTGAASLAGGVAGALVARFLASLVEPNVPWRSRRGLLIIAALVMGVAQRRCERRHSVGPARPPVVAAPLKALSREPYC